MGIPSGCGCVLVAKKCANNWQAYATGDAYRCKRMPEIMKANVLEARCSTDAKPDFVHAPKWPIFLLLSGKYMRIVRYARQIHENL
jgi:hypothetical protein